jgi:signal peptidase I
VVRRSDGGRAGSPDARSPVPDELMDAIPDTPDRDEPGPAGGAGTGTNGDGTDGDGTDGDGTDGGGTDGGGTDGGGTDRAGAGGSRGSDRGRRFLFSRGTWLFVLVVVVLAVLVPAFVARVYEVPSGSMETTLHGCTGCDNDRVLVDRLGYRFSEPVVGDIVVFAVPPTWHNNEFQPPPPGGPLARALGAVGQVLGIQRAGETDFVKRVIAVGGQTVSCCDSRNRLLVDGHPVDEPFVYYAPGFGPARQQDFPSVKVPDGMLWMMGDSRNDSVDSRAEGNGPVPLGSVIGQARMIVAPFARFGRIGGH